MKVLKNVFTNKKSQVKNHLKNCEKKNRKSKKEFDDIINLTDNEMEEVTNHKCQKVNNDSSGIKNNEKVLNYLFIFAE